MTTTDDICAVADALRRGLALATAVTEVEAVPLAEAAGRVLANDAVARAPLPPFDASAMDGYALRVEDLRGPGPWRLPVAGRIAAGEAGAVGLRAGTAMRIFTGAPIPTGADAVLMQERVTCDGEVIVIAQAPPAGANIRRAGDDLPAGARILRGGVVIGAREAAALAAVGMASVAVRRRVRVAIFCSGSELAEPGAPLAPGRIWNSNRFALRAALAHPWVALDDLGAIPDDPAALARTLRRAAETADIIVSTGGVSVGEEDHMGAALHAAGGRADVLRVAMKPGKPLLIGRIGASLYVGLPGNPVAAIIAWTLFGARFAAARAGIADHAPRTLMAQADFALTRRAGRAEFRPARISGTAPGGAPTLALLDSTFSARIALLCAADGLAELPAEVEHVAPGDMVRFIPL